MTNRCSRRTTAIPPSHTILRTIVIIMHSLLLLTQKMNLAIIKHHKLYPTVRKHPYHRGGISLPQRRRALLLHDGIGHLGHVPEAELRRRYLVEDFDAVDGRHDRFGYHAREAAGDEIAKFFGEGADCGEGRVVWRGIAIALVR